MFWLLVKGSYEDLIIGAGAGDGTTGAGTFCTEPEPEPEPTNSFTRSRSRSRSRSRNVSPEPEPEPTKNGTAPHPCSFEVYKPCLFVTLPDIKSKFRTNRNSPVPFSTTDTQYSNLIEHKSNIPLRGSCRKTGLSTKQIVDIVLKFIIGQNSHIIHVETHTCKAMTLNVY